MSEGHRELTSSSNPHGSVTGGESLLPAADVCVSGSAHHVRPIYPGTRTAAASLPAGVVNQLNVCDMIQTGPSLTDELLIINDDYQCVSQKVERTRPQSQEELSGVLEGVRALEALVQAADESQREDQSQSIDRLC